MLRHLSKAINVPRSYKLLNKNYDLSFSLKNITPSLRWAHYIVPNFEKVFKG